MRARWGAGLRSTATAALDSAGSYYFPPGSDNPQSVNFPSAASHPVTRLSAPPFYTLACCSGKSGRALTPRRASSRMETLSSAEAPN